MKLRTLPAVAIALGLLLSTAACGGGGDGGGGKGDKASSAAASSAASTTTAPDGATSSNAASTDGTTRPTAKPSRSGGAATSTTVGASAGSATTTTAPPPITGTPDKACAHPGDTQGLTVRGGNPKTPVIYDTVYSNKTNDLTSQYGTGSGNGKTGDDGVFHTTWELKPNVPPGLTYITFATKAGDHLARNYTTFKIVPLGTACP
jgi:hypothetical protein